MPNLGLSPRTTNSVIYFMFSIIDFLSQSLKLTGSNSQDNYVKYLRQQQVLFMQCKSPFMEEFYKK